MSDSEAAPELEIPAVTRAKTEVLEDLYAAKRGGKSMIVTQLEIQDAIAARGLKLGVGNPANFLKDIVRRHTANEQWPASLTAQRITARQRFGRKRVLEFVPFLEGHDDPFPDRFEPTEDTPTYDVQSVSIPSTARRLGREDETWLTQVVVNLRIVESLLAFKSDSIRSRLRDFTHLQTGMKTQAEIDATFILTADSPKSPDSEEHVFVTCEVKRKNERLLEDQIRMQVAQGFKETQKLVRPRIDGVKPIAIRIVPRTVEGKTEQLIYVVEFNTVDRTEFDAKWKPIPAKASADGKVDDTPVYGIPLDRASDAFFRLHPAVKGVS